MPRPCWTGLVARAEGRFSEAEALFKQVLEYRPKMVAASALTSLRPMTSADSDWLRSRQELLGADVSRLEQTDLLYSIGKYHDDLGSPTRRSPASKPPMRC